jgi:hydrogenase expression/formation protein HypE
MSGRIQLAHGGGGTLMQRLIAEELLALYGPEPPVLHDAARLTLPHGRLAFSTDGYVVEPLEFAGGDIGSLAITGTANDLAMAGARPRHLSVGLILEEGLELALLRRVVASMLRAAAACGVQVCTGDTKVVERGKADGLFITTSGIGELVSPEPIEPTAIRQGDQLLLSGDLGRHGVAILAARHGLALEPPVASASRWPAPARCWVSSPCTWPMRGASWRCCRLSGPKRPWPCWLLTAAAGSARCRRPPLPRGCCCARGSAPSGC